MHRYWVQGLIYFWTHDPAVPPAIRAKHAAQGLCKDEWPSNEHFPTQLYVREAARMVGDKVFTYPMREVSLSSLRCCCGFVVILSTESAPAHVTVSPGAARRTTWIGCQLLG